MRVWLSVYNMIHKMKGIGKTGRGMYKRAEDRPLSEEGQESSWKRQALLLALKTLDDGEGPV